MEEITIMDINELIKYLLTPVAQVSIIIGLAEIIKRQNWFAKEFIPIVDVVLGIISGICVYGLMLGHGIGMGIIIGLAEGLSACGLFSGIKNVSEGILQSKVDKVLEE